MDIVYVIIKVWLQTATAIFDSIYNVVQLLIKSSIFLHFVICPYSSFYKYSALCIPFYASCSLFIFLSYQLNLYPFYASYHT